MSGLAPKSPQKHVATLTREGTWREGPSNGLYAALLITTGPGQDIAELQAA